MDATVIAAIIAAATALVAVVVGPIITFKASKKSMLGPMRQAWINSLRDTVADFITSIYVSQIQISGSVTGNDDIRNTIEVNKRNQLEVSYRLKEKICLLINPKEVDHRELIRLVENALNASIEGRETESILFEVRKHAQIILKTEWDVVKK